MTSGGYSMTEAWNLQLQSRVREMEADLAEAEKHLTRLTQYGIMRPGPAEFDLARGFLKKIAAKRKQQAESVRDLEDLLGKEP